MCEQIAEDLLIPLCKTVIQLQQRYPDAEELLSRLGCNILGIVCGTGVEKYQMTPVIPLVGMLVMQILEEDPENILDGLEYMVHEAITSPDMVKSVQHWDNFLKMQESRVLDAALIHMLTPDADPDMDVYGELIRLGVGLLQCKQDTAIKVRLLHMMGEILDPQKPIMPNILTIVGRLLTLDEGIFLHHIIKTTFGKCHQFQLAPITMLTWTALDVVQAGEKHFNKGTLTKDDIKALFGTISYGLTYRDGFLWRLYRVVKERHNQ